MTKILWLFLLAGLAGCTERKCAQLEYERKDGAKLMVKNCFDISGSSVTTLNDGRSFERGFVIDPPAEQRRLAWMNEQPKEGVVKVVLTEE